MLVLNMVQKIHNNNKKTFFFDTLLKHFVKKGKKATIYRAFLSAVSSVSFPENTTFSTLFDILVPYVEVRSVRVRRFTNLVPFPLTRKRQVHIVSSWIYETIKKDKRRVSLDIKIAEEIQNILSKKGGSYEKKKEMEKLALKNRSNMHYRWY